MKVTLPLSIILLLASAQFSPSINNRQSGEQARIRETRSLSGVNLATILLQPGDLPARYSAGKVRFSDPGGFRHLPTTKNIVNLQIKKKRKLAGGMNAFYYMTDEEANRAYQARLDGLGESGRPAAIIRILKISGKEQS